MLNGLTLSISRKHSNPVKGFKRMFHRKIGLKYLKIHSDMNLRESPTLIPTLQSLIIACPSMKEFVLRVEKLEDETVIPLIKTFNSSENLEKLTIKAARSNMAVPILGQHICQFPKLRKLFFECRQMDIAQRFISSLAGSKSLTSVTINPNLHIPRLNDYLVLPFLKNVKRINYISPLAPDISYIKYTFHMVLNPKLFPPS